MTDSQAARMPVSAAQVALALVAGLVGCAAQPGPPTPPPQPAQPGQPMQTRQHVQAPPPSPSAPPGGAGPQTRAPEASRVRLETTRGVIVLEVQRTWAPHGVDRFHELVRAGYYNGAAVFRIRTGVFAQFGIAGDPAVAQRWRSATIPDDPRLLSNTRGTVAFAFKDPNGRTTQVFINLRDNSATFDAEPFVPFARIVEGMEVADALYAGYGERAGGGIRAGKQDPLFDGGNAYLRREFPDLDYILRATVVQ